MGFSCIGVVFVVLGVFSVCVVSGLGFEVEREIGGDVGWVELWDGVVFWLFLVLGVVGVVCKFGILWLGREEVVDLLVLLWWSLGLFFYFLGDLECIDCVCGVCLVF